jgi:hypothetical protein
MTTTTKPEPEVAPKRVFYAQPDDAKADLMPLYQALGKELDIKPACIRAIAVVETNEKPFAGPGAPVVRFEAHHWKKYRDQASHAVAFDKHKNARDLVQRWDDFCAMRRANEVAAILSHSFGMFQIMGFNYKACYCADPVAFLKEQMTVEGQFKMLKRLILSSPPLLSALRRQDPREVALHYNGRAYEKNKYHINWAAASKAGGDNAWA